MVNFTHVHASHIGYTHYLKRVNCQDASAICEFMTGSGPISAGLVFDGCSATKAPEVGSKGAATFVPLLIKDIFTKADEETLMRKPNLLVKQLYSVIQWQIFQIVQMMGATSTHDFDQIIFDHYMFTIVGYVITPKHLIIFRAGDGVHLVNDKLFVATSVGGAPSYLGHTLISPNNPGKYLLQDEGFQIRMFNIDTVRLVAAGTDPFTTGVAKTMFGNRLLGTNQEDLDNGLKYMFDKQITFDDMAISKSERSGN